MANLRCVLRERSGEKSENLILFFIWELLNRVVRRLSFSSTWVPTVCRNWDPSPEKGENTVLPPWGIHRCAWGEEIWQAFWKIECKGDRPEAEKPARSGQRSCTGLKKVVEFESKGWHGTLHFLHYEYRNGQDLADWALKTPLPHEENWRHWEGTKCQKYTSWRGKLRDAKWRL